MKLKLICFSLIFNSLIINACPSANQFKIFPIGIDGDKIITFNAFLHRDGYPVESEDGHSTMSIGWNIKYFIATYNLKGKLLSKNNIETLVIDSEHYVQKLSNVYEKAVERILVENKKLEPLTPDYISNCDFQKNCKILSLKHNTEKNLHYLVYQKKEYQINLNAFQKFKRSATFTDNLDAYYLNSTRVYKGKKIKIVIGHVATGHEIIMGWITNDPNKKPKDEFDVVILAKEHEPNIKFDQISKTIYEEKLLHHGYGFDLLITKEIK
ncbi:hypothetical protein [Tenacibaculum sp. 190524A05c]|uniref:hypothetical protein n=1 Tax=Tenacibaculum platacis TaxID=3137852 RepID=UPI0032B2A557